MNLDERLERATEDLLARADTDDPDALYARITGRRRRPRGQWIAVATAVAAVVAAAVAVPRLVDRDVRIDDPPFTDSTEPADIDPTAVPPDGADGSGAGTWVRVDDPDAVFSGAGAQVIEDLATFDGTAVAVGSDRGDAAIWVAPVRPDRWLRVDADLCGAAPCAIGDVTAVPGGFLAVGDVDGTPTSWASPDGEDWTRSPMPSPAEGRVSLHEVAAAHDGPTVALGTVADADGDVAPIAYWADDVTGTWRHVLFGDASEPETPVSFTELTWFVTAVGEGAGLRFVALAHAGDSFDLAVATDGADWKMTPPNGGVFEPYPTFPAALIADGDRLLALGSAYLSAEADGAVWSSWDGVTWVRADGDDLGGPGHQAVLGAGRVGSYLVAVGEEWREGAATGHPAAWLQREDGTWQRLDGGGPFATPGSLTRAVQFDASTTLVAGIVPDGSEPDAALWLYVLEGAVP